MAIVPKNRAAAPAASSPAPRERPRQAPPSDTAPQSDDGGIQPTVQPAQTGQSAGSTAGVRGFETSGAGVAASRAAEGEPEGVAGVASSGPAATQPPKDDLDSWAATGEEGAAKSAAIAREQERKRDEARARGFWPRRFRINSAIPPENRADIIILDAKPGPRYYEHNLRNPRDENRWSIYEPCPKDWESCPLCPPNGERESTYTLLLSVIDMRGYNSTKEGRWIAGTRNLLGLRTNDHAYIDNLWREHGTLRGIHLVMVRESDRAPAHGTPEFVRKYSDEQIAKWVDDNALRREIRTREGELIWPADHMLQPFDYSTFLHRPAGADLRSRYGGAAPFGSSGGAGSYGRGRNQSGVQTSTQGFRGGPGGQVGSFDQQHEDASEWGGGQFDPGNADVDANLGWGDGQTAGAPIDDSIEY
jgi:hypothetical protein